jgi:hypothetical protein
MNIKFNHWVAKPNGQGGYSIIKGTLTPSLSDQQSEQGYEIFVSAESYSDPAMLVYNDLGGGDYEIVESQEKIDDHNRKERGKLKRNLGQSVADFISGYNDEIKNITVQQSLTTLAAFESPEKFLKGGYIETARDLIAAADLTGTIYIEDDRTKILEYLDEKIAYFNEVYPAS